MLIASYSLEIAVSPHSVMRFGYEAIAHLGVDISPALPFLNATLPGGTYLPAGPALSWRFEDHKVAFWSDRIAVDDLESREQGEEVVRRLVALVNDTWQRRAEITPDVTTHERLQPLELYRLLPRTNCGVCGETTCFNLALKLAAGQAAAERCRPLHEEEQAAPRAELERLLATRWPAL